MSLLPFTRTSIVTHKLQNLQEQTVDYESFLEPSAIASRAWFSFASPLFTN